MDYTSSIWIILFMLIAIDLPQFSGLAFNQAIESIRTDTGLAIKSIKGGAIKVKPTPETSSFVVETMKDHLTQFERESHEKFGFLCYARLSRTSHGRSDELQSSLSSSNTNRQPMHQGIIENLKRHNKKLLLCRRLDEMDERKAACLGAGQQVDDQQLVCEGQVHQREDPN
ncbi:hypothetical protein RF11_09689 [Thelohanellus kitauei]|uniref:Uncharacterized protein n=1 Tax=Thelohanellus kitauei TaxID=669202 RepID=A0A0C2MT02_THEKT|nr:hypothetical protein RF11_09689 [Thelohanellus kitauei]